MRDVNLSIHPRNWPGMWEDRRTKSRTSRPKSLEVRRRVLSALRAHLEVHPNNNMARARLTKLEQEWKV
jgi:hypothetical protein